MPTALVPFVTLHTQSPEGSNTPQRLPMVAGTRPKNCTQPGPCWPHWPRLLALCPWTSPLYPLWASVQAAPPARRPHTLWVLQALAPPVVLLGFTSAYPLPSLPNLAWCWTHHRYSLCQFILPLLDRPQVWPACLRAGDVGEWPRQVLSSGPGRGSWPRGQGRGHSGGTVWAVWFFLPGRAQGWSMDLSSISESPVSGSSLPSFSVRSVIRGNHN